MESESLFAGVTISFDKDKRVAPENLVPGHFISEQSGNELYKASTYGRHDGYMFRGFMGGGFLLVLGAGKGFDCLTKTTHWKVDLLAGDKSTITLIGAEPIVEGNGPLISMSHFPWRSAG